MNSLKMIFAVLLVTLAFSFEEDSKGGSVLSNIETIRSTSAADDIAFDNLFCDDDDNDDLSLSKISKIKTKNSNPFIPSASTLAFNLIQPSRSPLILPDRTLYFDNSPALTKVLRV